MMLFKKHILWVFQWQLQKHNYLITDASEIPQILKEAKYIATTGRPGPVLIDIPKDILNQQASWVEPGVLELPGYKPTLEPNPKMIQQAANLIKNLRNQFIRWWRNHSFQS